MRREDRKRAGERGVGGGGSVAVGVGVGVGVVVGVGESALVVSLLARTK